MVSLSRFLSAWVESFGNFVRPAMMGFEAEPGEARRAVKRAIERLGRSVRAT